MASRFGVPVYLYEEASTNPARKNLEDIRRGEFEGLAAKMASPGWAPDFGPAAPHPSAGASVIGARMPLIAYNINLNTDRLDVAKKIAAAIRHSSGGFRYVKAAGFKLEDRGIVQVSMNLTNYEKTPIFRVFETVKREAERYGVSILESEIVGLVPSAALNAAPSTTCRSPASTRTRFSRTSSTVSTVTKSGCSKTQSICLRLCLCMSRRPQTGSPSSRRAGAIPKRFHLPIEVAALDAEGVGGAGDVAVLRGERAQDVVALEALARLVQRQRRRAGRPPAAAIGAAVEERQVGERDRVARHHDHQPLDHVAQLAHVAGPAVAAQAGRGAGVEPLRPPAVLARELRHEVLGEQRDVVARDRAAAARRSG